MRIIMRILIIIFIVALPALCFGGKYQIEGTQFDLNNSTNETGFYIKGTVNDSSSSGILEGVEINIEDNTNQYKNRGAKRVAS